MSRACLPNIVCCGASSLNVMQHSTLRCDDTPRQSGTRSCRILRGKGPVLLLCVSVSLFFFLFPFSGSHQTSVAASLSKEGEVCQLIGKQQSRHLHMLCELPARNQSQKLQPTLIGDLTTL